MADPTTPNYGLTQPAVGGDGDAWGALINTDLGLIDTAIFAALIGARGRLCKYGLITGSAQSYAPSAAAASGGVTLALVWGAGGAGGGCSTPGSGSSLYAMGNGGNAGNFAIFAWPNPTTQTITPGVGGVPGAAGAAGGAGGSTTVGSILTVNGGNGGLAMLGGGLGTAICVASNAANTATAAPTTGSLLASFMGGMGESCINTTAAYIGRAMQGAQAALMSVGNRSSIAAVSGTIPAQTVPGTPVSAAGTSGWSFANGGNGGMILTQTTSQSTIGGYGGAGAFFYLEFANMSLTS